MRVAANWQGVDERGGLFVLRLTVLLARVFGRTLVRAVLVPVCLWYLWTVPGARAASRAWLRRVGHPSGFHDSLCHVHAFATVTLDRVYLLAGDTAAFDIRLRGEAALKALVAERGALVLVSHFGSTDVMRATAAFDDDVPVSIVMDRQHGAQMTRVLEAINPALATRVIDATQSPIAVGFQIRKALEAHSIVGVMADRVVPGEDVVVRDFCGDPAEFPLSMFLLAASLGAPLVVCLASWEGGARYDVEFIVLHAGEKAPRASRRSVAESLQRRYIRELERRARSSPLNWFNFYEFWKDAGSH